MSTPDANSYDEFPYNDGVFPETSPDRSAAMATLYGMSPEDPARARILELGCANGGNLFVMAAAMPEAQFVGIDLSEGQTTTADDARLRYQERHVRQLLLDVGDDFACSIHHLPGLL